MSERGTRPRGLGNALGQLAAAAVDLLRTRAELAALEFDEARERAKDRITLLVVGLGCLAMATLSVTAFVVAYFWDTHRLEALGIVTLAYLFAGVIALWRFSVHRQNDPKPFAATIAELERDREWLASGSGERK
jgi:uncharacterized membrane protein YqjE